jgi:hypothetical protein
MVLQLVAGADMAKKAREAVGFQIIVQVYPCQQLFDLARADLGIVVTAESASSNRYSPG